MNIAITPYVIAVSTVTPIVIEKVKASPYFPGITPETTRKLTALSVFMTALGSTLALYQAGNLNLDASFSLVEAGANFAAAFGLTELVYKFVIKPVSARLQK